MYFCAPSLCLLQVSRVSLRRSFTQTKQHFQVKCLLLFPPPWSFLPRYLRDLLKAECHQADLLQFPHLLASHKQLCEPVSLQQTCSGEPREEVEEEGGKKAKAKQKEEQLMVGKEMQHR